MNQSSISPSMVKSDFPKYREPYRCSTDLNAALEKFNSLRLLKRECVVDGHLYNLINLEGTLPIIYKGATYHIPLRVMLLEDYPSSAPLVYIQPTEAMKMARNIEYLNDRGKVSIEYLQMWEEQRHPDISMLLLRLSLVFSETPPVWTKKTGNIVKMYEDKAKRSNYQRARSYPRMAAEQEHQRNNDNEYEEIGENLPSLPPPLNRRNNREGHEDDNQQDRGVPYGRSKSLNTIQEPVHSPINEEVGLPASKHSDENDPIVQASGTSPCTTEYLSTCSKGRIKIGSGGFAKVFLYQKGEEKVACKIVDLGDNDDNVQKYVKALKKEIRLLRTLDHHFIVKYISVEEYNNELAMVMEYFPQGSLYQVLQKTPEGYFSENRTRVYTWQILQGLKYLHENKVVHKDIKARNILLDEHDTIRIADFGISKKIVNLVTETTGGSDKMVGSIYWQSPESLSPDTKCDMRTDTWSLGCTVVEMLVGKPPLSCDGIIPLQAFGKIVNYEVYPPNKCSDSAKEFLQMCFRKLDERPASRDLMANSEFPKYSLD